MQFDQIQNQMLAFQNEWGWLPQVVLIFSVAALVDFVSRKIFRGLKIQADKTQHVWDTAFTNSVTRPFTLLIWLLCVTFSLELIYTQYQWAWLATVSNIRVIGVILLLAWFLLRFIHKVEIGYIENWENRGVEFDRTTIDAVVNVSRVSVLIVAGLILLQTLGFSIAGVLTFGGIGGLAVGFAAKDLLANFFGGLMIYLDSPFKIGDWIRSPDREIEGTVEKIGWRITTIRRFDKRPIYVPNSMFANITVENPSRMTHRRIYETVGIRYDDVDQMRDIVAEVKQMLVNHPEIDASQTLMVNFNTFGPSSLDFFIYTFTKTTVWTEYHRIKEDVLLKAHDIIRQHNAEVAFPTSTVHLATPENQENSVSNKINMGKNS